MPCIEVQTEIDADIEKCFNLARDLTFYQNSLKKPTEIAIAGKVSGLVQKNDFTLWETRHLYFHQHLTLKVTEFEAPVLFVDEMVKGGFKQYKHKHIFKEECNKTIMIDEFYFESPYGILGKLYDSFFLKKHITNLLVYRNKVLKEKAESY
ncbi:SRPBCC family protein [Tamlana sp. 62-3]|uniref:SRPBCC family protein n=1 Tax=Neotamlana sargassicola TaxID=2883125 RepID=A0A9X1L4J2_9FLAO|nr:SRPBCC family protein [Tamlana sargassicola]MCB4808130.1 SRPBCC family protein [Tamlana sargassicola]